MKRLALIVPLFLLLIGCESDFDKCFKINEEKVIKETVSGLDGEKASLPSGSRALRTSYGLIERLVPNEYADYFKAFDDQYRRGCLNQMGTIYYSGNKPVCVQSAGETKEKYDAVFSAITLIPMGDFPTKSGVDIKTSATDICNGQGLYE